MLGPAFPLCSVSPALCAAKNADSVGGSMREVDANGDRGGAGIVRGAPVENPVGWLGVHDFLECQPA